MRVIVQRVTYADCKVNGNITGKIDKGYMILVGFGLHDDEKISARMAEKLAKLRVFEDGEGKMNLNIFDAGGDILSISQFTLYADCAKGNRPSFTDAAKAEEAERLYKIFNEQLRALGLKVEEGIFGADMKISLLNDGPVTIIMDSEELW